MEVYWRDRRSARIIRRAMRTTINVPDSVYRRAERAAKSRGLTVEQLIVAAFERVVVAEADSVSSTGRVKLPLVPSKQPGSLDLSKYNFDDLFA
jgi:hypothetical protein